MPNMPLPYGPFGNGENLAHREGAGSYQLADGSWQRSEKMVFDGSKLVIKDGAAGKLRFDANAIRQLEVKADTFIVMAGLPGQSLAEGPAFYQSCVNLRGVRLLAQYPRNSKATYILSRPDAAPLLLPTGKARFKAAMLEVVKDCPALTEQITDGSLRREEVVQIVQEYADCRRRGKAAF